MFTTMLGLMLAQAAAPASAPPPQRAPAVMPFSEAVRVGDTLYLSGQLGIAPGTRAVVAGGIAAETKQTMDNIGVTLRKYGLTHGDLVKCTVFLADMAEWGAMNSVYMTYFQPGKFPARSALGVNGLALGARTEIECLGHFSAGHRGKKG